MAIESTHFFTFADDFPRNANSAIRNTTDMRKNMSVGRTQTAVLRIASRGSVRNSRRASNDVHSRVDRPTFISWNSPTPFALPQPYVLPCPSPVVLRAILSPRCNVPIISGDRRPPARCRREGQQLDQASQCRGGAATLQKLRGATRVAVGPAVVQTAPEKPSDRTRRERIPRAEEIVTLLKGASPAFRLIYTGLSQSGARPGELCRAQISNVDWTKGTITLPQHKTARKTGKPRVIPIGKNFGKTLQTAIDRRPAGPIFRSPKGRDWTVENLSGTHRRLRDAAGLPKDLVLYLARHRFGTETASYAPAFP